MYRLAARFTSFRTFAGLAAGVLLPVIFGSTAQAAGASRGISAPGPWVSYYGSANRVDLQRMASTFRVFDIDADPGVGNFTPAHISQLKAGGANKVLSYLNIGSCENFRDYWKKVPSGFLSCSANKAAQRGTYAGYADELWMDPSNFDYQRLIVDYVAPRLVAQGVDGFYLDNMEIVEHGATARRGRCDATCRQGGLDLVRKLREKYPSLTIVMQNATSDVTRLGTTGGASFATLLDGIAHEEVYGPVYDADAEAELKAWYGMGLKPGGAHFWIGTLDYVGSCSNTTDASSDFARSRARYFSPSASDASGGQNVVCYWSF